MTIVYVTDGTWGSGTGSPLAAAAVDGNFYDVDQRIAGLVTDLAQGKRIDTVDYTSGSMTFHFTDGTSQVIALPIATLTYVGPWANSTPYQRNQMISADNGFYQVLQDHTSPAPPALFDPNAVDGSSNPLYQLFMPLRDVNYDAAIFVPGSIQREANELLVQFIANRPMRLEAGDVGAYAYLDIGNDSTGATDIILSIEGNGVEFGTITFATGVDIDTAGGQVGNFNIPIAITFVEGDRYGLRVTQSNNAEPAGLSVTLPFVRTDI
jgi:hypothetical protein